MRRLLSIAALSIVLLAGASPAQALIGRAWVSGKGVDTPSCGPTAKPCRSLQYAHDNIVAAGGEIDILDPAGYGTVTITKAISIVNDGVGTVGMFQAAAGQSAIVINAGPNDAVALRGLNVQGASGANFGVLFNSGGALTISKCVFQNFGVGAFVGSISGTGVTRISLTDIVASGGDTGIVVAAPGTARLSGDLLRITATGNKTAGIAAAAQDTARVLISIRDSVAANNGSNTANGVDSGVLALSSTLTAKAEVQTRNVTASGNKGAGFLSSGTGAMMRVGHSVASGNAAGFSTNATNVAPTAGLGQSYGDNAVIGNAIDGAFPIIAAQ